MTFVIGITGAAGVGKSSLAIYLQNACTEADLDALVVSFAAPLKAMLDTLGPYPEDKQAHVPHMASGISYRRLCQSLGDWGRQLDPDFWVEPMRRFIADCEHDVVIIDDVRMTNEGHLCERHGTVVGIRGVGFDLGPLAGHSSEQTRVATEHEICAWAQHREVTWETSARLLSDRLIDQVLEGRTFHDWCAQVHEQAVSEAAEDRLLLSHAVQRATGEA